MMTNLTDLTNLQSEEYDSAALTEFYKRAYTGLLKQRVVDSCNKVTTSGEILQEDIETLLKDMQEMLYNCNSAETTAAKQDLEDPQTSATRTIEDLADLISELRKYKLRLLSSD